MCITIACISAIRDDTVVKLLRSFRNDEWAGVYSLTWRFRQIITGYV